MTQTKTEEAKKPEEINIIQEYNTFAQEIPWKSLKELPQKLAPLKKYAHYVGVKDLDLNSLDFYEPVKRVVVFMGVLVKRLHNVEKEAAQMKKELAEIRGRHEMS